MATTAYCVFCFECLSSSLHNRSAPSLSQVEDSWEQYKRQDAGTLDDKARNAAGGAIVMDLDEDDDDEEEEDPIPASLKPPSLNALRVPSPASASASASSASTPSSLSATSSQAALAPSSKSSSSSSFFSFMRRSDHVTKRRDEEYPLFVTWDTVSGRGHKSLRGCIGTFEDQEIEGGLKNYALTSAFDDTRFPPITASELPSLAVGVTLLTDFEPCSSPLDWVVGKHGLRISFSYHSKRYGATYLPDVPVEQGWTKEETLVSLMRKAGWSGRSSEWRKVGDLRCVRYQGQKISLDYRAWKSWKDWVNKAHLPNLP